MKAKVFDFFAGEEEVNIKFDKFVSKQLSHINDDTTVDLKYGTPKPGENILVLDRGELVSAVYFAIGTGGAYWFQDWNCWRSVYKTDGWCHWSQFE